MNDLLCCLVPLVTACESVAEKLPSSRDSLQKRSSLPIEALVQPDLCVLQAANLFVVVGLLYCTHKGTHFVLTCTTVVQSEWPIMAELFSIMLAGLSSACPSLPVM